MEPIPPPDENEEILRSEGPISTTAELRQVEARAAVGANIVYEAVRREGDEELKRPAQALAWSGLAAGLSMGFSLVAEALLRAHLPARSWSPLISKFGYCLGFLIVILGRQQLFTENTLTVMLPLLLRRDRTTLVRVARLWGVVLLSNLVGTYLFALGIARTAVFDPAMRATLAEIGRAHYGFGFTAVLWRAIFAGWLIALTVWLLPVAESRRVAIIVILTYIVGLGGFSHVVAGSTPALYLVVTHAARWGQYLGGFFLPTVLGNLIGGVALVAALAHAQVLGGAG